MDKDFSLEKYMSDGVRNIVEQAVRNTLSDPKESIFIAKYARAAKRAEKIRHKYEQDGEHIPPVIIASITTECNLHCAGCYSRANHATVDGKPRDLMDVSEWDNVFSQAKEMGIGFMILAGGEPTIRRDVIETASKYPEIIFPIFTNGTIFDDGYMKLADKHRNLIPVFSVEGHQLNTDKRRGDGVFKTVTETMQSMKERHLIFGVSVTQTKRNREEITGDGFIEKLRDHGAKVIFYVEYVPVAKGTEVLAPDDLQRELMKADLARVREKYPDIIFIAFPGDEKTSGGCLASGRGFFHINAHGGAEPCPFSPYSDINVKNRSLREVLHSRLFTELQKQDIMDSGHIGGCVLYEKREQVERICAMSQ